MSAKSEVSRNYMELWKYKTKDFKYPDMPKVMITGDSDPRSIGHAIKSRFINIDSYAGDVVEAYNRDFVMYDTLIMCHGVMHLDWFEDAPQYKMRNCIDVNLNDTIAMTQKFVKDTLAKRVRKRIIAIGSMAYRSVLNGSAAYCASKAGLAHFMKCIAWELAPKGYDVFIIHPSNVVGTMMTEQTIDGLARYRGLSKETATEYWSDNNPRESFLTPSEIADVVENIMGLKGRPPMTYMAGCQIELGGGQR